MLALRLSTASLQEKVNGRVRCEINYDNYKTVYLNGTGGRAGPISKGSASDQQHVMCVDRE